MLSKENFKPTQEMVNAAANVFKTMALKQTIEPIVIGCQRKILEKYQFRAKNQRTPELSNNKIITDPSETWLLNDEDFSIYLHECNIEREKAGLHVDNPEFCPLLVAENMEREAERILIIAMEPLAQISLNQLIHAGYDKYEKFIDLCLRLLAPYVKIKGL